MINASAVFRAWDPQIPGLDFRKTRIEEDYKSYWESPPEDRAGGLSPAPLTCNNKYWTRERWWNASGYDKAVIKSKAFFKERSIDELYKTSTLVDLGSGKGHAVLSFAWEWGFNKVVGVEINEKYFHISNNNITQIKKFLHMGITGQRKIPRIAMMKEALEILNGPMIEIYQGDATDFQFSDEMNFIFMFNPFGPVTTQAVVQNLIKSLDSSPREVYILYNNAIHRRFFLDSGRFKTIYRDEKYFILKGK